MENLTKNDDWEYNGTPFTSDSLKLLNPMFTHFIYQITDNEGKIYIGYKGFYSSTKKKFGKKKLAAVEDKRLKKYEIVTKESNWKSYWSSCKDLQINYMDRGGIGFKRKILMFCTQSNFRYYEAFYQFKMEVLHRESYNENILGKFFRNNI